jgi:heavy metal translocating P-type ATPase
LSEFPPFVASPGPGSSGAKIAAHGRCDLCGLPVRNSRAVKVAGRQALHFCCPGCRQVFQILSSSSKVTPEKFRETELYRACLEAGIIPRDEKDLETRGARGKRAGSDSPSPEIDQGLEMKLKVEGMWCPSCSWLIEEVLSRLRGVLGVKVFFLSDLASIQYLPHRVTPQDILQKISDLGYRPSLWKGSLESSRERKDLLLRLGISAILTVNIMMISFSLYLGFFQDLGEEAIGYLSYPLWLLATPVIFYGGWPILRRACAGLFYGHTSMDTLISVGSLSAYFYSLFQMFRGTLHLYFDTASMLVTLVLLGRYLESRAREKVASGITDLQKLTRQKVRLSNFDIQGGRKERWVSSEGVAAGDEFLIYAGERVLLDGRVISGRGNVDESILTGEARPVAKKVGDEIMGGVLLLDGELGVRAYRVGADSSLGQMITLMQEALEKKNPAEVLADRITRWLVPVILGVAGATAASLWLRGFPPADALLRSITVLVISCPCALGIATPIVKVAAMGLAKSRGILVCDPGALERVKLLDTFVFDKTGTLTEGNFSLQEVITVAMPEEEALDWVASVEVHSDHYLARELLQRAQKKSIKVEGAQAFESLEGMGVKGRVKGREVFIGNRRLITRDKIDLPPGLNVKALAFEEKGMTAVFFGWGKEVKGVLVFGDSLRKGTSELIQKLRAKGITPWIVSGDGPETTRAIAGEAGVSHYRGQALPHDKVELIESLQSSGHRVGMVGDGINDAPALARADVGFALGAGANILREASDITFLGADPARIVETLELSTLAVRAIRQNLFFAFFYNTAGIPLAAAGLLNPIIAVLAMFASSLTVIGNALRISRIKTPWFLFKRISCPRPENESK